MKSKDKVVPTIKEKKELWSLPKNKKVSFDQALMNLGVHFKH